MTERRRRRDLLWFGIGSSVTSLVAFACSSGDPFTANGDGGAAGSASDSGGSTIGASGTRGGGGTSGASATASGGAGADGGAGLASQSGSGGENESAGAPSAPEGGAGGDGSSTCAVGYAHCSANPADACETALNTTSDCGKCGNACTAVKAPFCVRFGVEHSCSNPASALVGQRLELPCIAATLPSQLCESVAVRASNCPVGGKVVSKKYTMGGEAGVTYNVTLRIRGVLEPKTYAGGMTGTDHFYVGGAPTISNYNTYRLVVSAPAQTYYLNYDNAKGEAYEVFPLDHSKVIPMTGGASLTLEVVDPDCAMVKNCKSFDGACDPYVVANVPPAPAGFNGQFVHVDVVNVANAN